MAEANVAIVHEPLRQAPSRFEVSRWSVADQCKMADVICITNAQNEEFLADQSRDWLEDPNWEKNFAYWNVTSIGNAAYLSVHAPTARYRNLYRTLLVRYCDWLEGRQRQDLCVTLLTWLCIGLFVSWCYGV